MMRNFLFVGLICLILGILAGFPIGEGCAPKVKVGTTTVVDSIRIHDTVVTTKTDSQFTVSKQIVYVPKYFYIDSGKTKKDSIKVLDTSTCYSFDEHEKDGTYIMAQMCSDSLPKHKPLDLHGSITYKAKSDTIKHLITTDTIIKSNSTPFFEDWRNYAILALGAAFVITNVHGR